MDPYLGEIRLCGFVFPPKGWAFCNGSLMPIAQNQALFALLGTQYGGDGVSTFALPDLRGRAPLDQGQGPGLSPRSIGERGGVEAVTLSEASLPAHVHPLNAFNGLGTEYSPKNNAIAEPNNPTIGAVFPAFSLSTSAQLTPLSTSGGNTPHNNIPPVLCLNFIIALQGVFPQRA